MAKTKDTGLARSTPTEVAFVYNETSVRRNEDGLVSLTDMWKAAESPDNKDPSTWSHKSGSDFIDFIAETLNTPRGRIYKSVRGKGVGGTFAHWQVGLAYAKYLSHAFHAHVNAAYREWEASRAGAGYRKQGKPEIWIEARELGKLAYKALKSTMTRHNCKVIGDDNPFADSARVITIRTLGRSPSEMRVARGLVKKSQQTRDSYTQVELARLYCAQVEADNLIKEEGALGNRECVGACDRAAQAVRQMADGLRGRQQLPGG